MKSSDVIEHENSRKNVRPFVPEDFMENLDKALQPGVQTETRVKTPHDSVGARVGAGSQTRGPIDLDYSGGAAPGLQHNPTADRDPLLSTRQVIHGNFKENARISQGIKEWLRSSDGWKALDDVEREAMDMIALKFSRLLSGKSLERQHWEDVVGYAKLAEEQCK